MLASRIAWRYALSKKSHSAVNIISAISVAGVAVATAAIVVVLSVFNGFTRLAASRLSAIDPDLRIVPAGAPAFADADSLALALEALPQISAAVPVVQERGLAICGSRQMPVVFKGVPDGYSAVSGVESIIIDGACSLSYPPGSAQPAALLSSGAAVNLNARPGHQFSLYVPRRLGRINPASPQTAFRGAEFIAAGVWEVEQSEFDSDFMFIPLAEARSLLEYGTEGTAIEASVAPGIDPARAAKAVEEALGGSVRALTREQQESDSFKMIMIEKWVTFLMLAFILVIASFNIISTLSLLVIEKRDNMATLRALGATKGLVRKIFAWQGWLISLAGGIAGIALGTALALAQEHFGIIKLAGDPARMTINVYPVSVEGADLLAVLGLVALVAAAASLSTLLMRTDNNRN